MIVCSRQADCIPVAHHIFSIGIDLCSYNLFFTQNFRWSPDLENCFNLARSLKVVWKKSRFPAWEGSNMLS